VWVGTRLYRYRGLTRYAGPAAPVEMAGPAETEAPATTQAAPAETEGAAEAEAEVRERPALPERMEPAPEPGVVLVAGLVERSRPLFLARPARLPEAVVAAAGRVRAHLRAAPVGTGKSRSHGIRPKVVTHLAEIGTPRWVATGSCTA